MRTIKTWLATIVMLLCSITAGAEDVEIDGVWYKLDPKNRQAEVICNSSDGYIGDITIPESVISEGVEYAVSSIGSNAFEGCWGLNSISIPASVTSIGFKAFYDCSSLTEIAIPGSVASIGGHAFVDCINLTTIIIPKDSKLTSIVSNTFRGCRRLTEIAIPDSVKSVGVNAFEGCCDLTFITIPKSVTKIENYAFRDCNGLKEVIIEDGSETLMLGYNDSYSGSSTGQGLFNDCPLETVYLGRNLNYVSGGDWGYSPFYNQTQLTSVTIGDSVTGIGYYAFSGCGRLTEVIIPKNVRTIGDDAFSGCYSLSSITIGENVRNIGPWAFQNCHNLTSFSIPKGVASIGNYVFDGCTNLKELIIEDGGGTLSLGCNDYYSSGTGQGLFNDCPLESVYLGRDISYDSRGAYGYSPFYNRTKLTTVTIGDRVTSIGDNAFRWCTSLANLIIPENVTSIGKEAFWNCHSLTSITIPKSVTRIWAEAFAGCRKLTTVNIGDIVAWCKIDFSDSNSNPLYHTKEIYLNGELIKELIIPEDVTSIKNYTFYNCNSLISVVIPEGVTSIGNSAFYGCDSLTSVTIPASVTRIGNKAFSGCTGELTINCNIPSGGVYDDCPFRDSEFTKVTIGDKVTSIGGYAFYDCESLTSITISRSVASIGDCAFEYCSNLTFITIPEGVTSIGWGAFSGCSSLTAVHISSLEAWCNIDFEVPNANPLCQAKNLYLNGELVTELAIPNSVTEIKDYAFYNCRSLTSITIPEGVTSIGSSAFCDCNNLKKVINYSDLILQKGSSSNGYVAYYAEEVINTVTVSGIKLSQAAAALVEGETLTLIATVLPNNATDKRIAWSSSRESVASVDNTGKVTAVAEGTATITAAVGDMQATCVVTVKKKEDDKVDGDVEAEFYFVVWMHNGARISFPLVEHPVLTYADGGIVVTTSQEQLTYPHASVRKFTLTDEDISQDEAADVAVTVRNAQWYCRGDVMAFSDCTPGERVIIYNATGQQIAQYAISADGTLQIPLSEFVEGMYVVKSESITYKFMKK